MPPSSNQSNYFRAIQQQSRLPGVAQVWRWVGRDESGLAVIQSQRGDVVKAWLAGNAAVADGQPVLYVPPGAGEVLGQVQLPTVLVAEDVQTPVIPIDSRERFRIAMILDSNWCFTEPVTAESVALLKILTNKTSRIITPPIDSRVLQEEESLSSPLDGGAAIAAAAGIEVIEQPLNESAEGFIWLPILKPDERFTATELDAIKRNAPEFSALLIGEWTAWGGGAASYNGHLVELFQPGFAETATSVEGEVQDLRVPPNLTVTMDAIGYWNVNIPEERIIGRLINRPEDAPNSATGKPGAIWLGEDLLQ